MTGAAKKGARTAPSWAFVVLIVLTIVAWPQLAGLGLMSGMACDSGCTARGEALVYSIIAVCALLPPLLAFLCWREMRGRRRLIVLVALSPVAVLFILFELLVRSGLFGVLMGWQ